MSKKLRGSVVEKVEHRQTKRTGVVRLSKDSMEFFARENDADHTLEPFVSKNGGEVRAWLLVQLGRTTPADRLDWIPVIKVDYGHDDRSYWKESGITQEGMRVELSRFYIALTIDEREWRKLEWKQVDPKSSTRLDENDMYSQSHKYNEGPKSQNLTQHTRAFKLPHFIEGSRGDLSILPYTVELWTGLLDIVKRIKESREMLAELVGTKQGIALLTQVGAGKTQLRLGKGTE